MAEVGMDGIWELDETLRRNDKQQSTNSVAEVTHIDVDGTVWVHLPGGAEETPINGFSTADVKPGDSVRVSIEDGQASIVGNATAPAVGQEQVNETVSPVKQTAEKASTEAAAAAIAANEASNAAATALSTAQSVDSKATNAQAMAQSAKDVADAVSQHFWHADDGAHVTEVTQDEWNDEGGEKYHSGPNSLWNSLGMLFRNGLNNLLAILTNGIAIYDGEGNEADNIIASFSDSGQRIGKLDESHMLADYHSLQLVDKDGITYFWVSDLRDKSDDLGYYEKFTATGENTFYTSLLATSIIKVTVDGIQVDEGLAYNRINIPPTDLDSPTGIIFNEAPAEGSNIAIEYYTLSTEAKAYTFGIRKSGKIGAMSVAEGRLTTASGSYSHAEGYETEATAITSHAEGYQTRATGNQSHSQGSSTLASGYASHAEGTATTASGNNSHAQGSHTVAKVTNQTALGQWNVENSTSAIILGNGTSSARSNALTVDWSGNVVAGTYHTETSNSSVFEVKNTTVDLTQSNNGVSATQAYYVVFRAKDSGAFAYLGGFADANGTTRAQLTARNVVNGSQVNNALTLGVTKDGTRTVSVSESAPWRTALGINLDCMTIKLSATTAVSNSYTKVPMVADVKTGSNLSLSASGIKCAKAGYVKVSANGYINGCNNTNVCNFQIWKNGTAVAHGSARAVSDRALISIAPRLVQVAAGDVIYLYAANTSSATGNIIYPVMNWLTVEYV